MTLRTPSTPSPLHHTDILSSSEVNPSCGFQSLPDEVMLMVFRELSAQNTAIANRVCRHWYRLLDDKPLWNFFLIRDFAISETQNPKELYQKCYHRDANFARGIYATSTIQLGRPTQCVSVKGQKLIAGFSDGTIEIWDLHTRTCEKKWTGHTSIVNSLFLTETGEILSGSYDCSIKIWNNERFDCKHRFTGNIYPVMSLILANEGILITGDVMGDIRIYDLIQGTLNIIQGEHTKSISSLILTKKGKLVSGSEDKNIKIWNVKQGICELTLEGHHNRITSLCLTIDGKLVSGSEDRKIKIWDLKTGMCEMTLEGHQAGVSALCLSKWGKLLSGSDGGRIKVWDLERGVCEMTLRTGGDFSKFLHFTDNDRLVSVSTNGEVQILDFSASHEEVFEELANKFEGNARDISIAMERFSRMPLSARGKIWREIQESMNPLSDHRNGGTEDHLAEANGLDSSPKQKAAAIRKYLGTIYTKLG